MLKKYANQVVNPEDMIFFLNHSGEDDYEIDDDNDYEELSSIIFQDVSRSV